MFIIFLITAHKHLLWTQWSGSKSNQNLCLKQNYINITIFHPKSAIFRSMKDSHIFHGFVYELEQCKTEYHYSLAVKKLLKLCNEEMFICCVKLFLLRWKSSFGSKGFADSLSNTIPELMTPWNTYINKRLPVWWNLCTPKGL